MSRISSFQEFWPFYLSEHQQAKSRFVHFIGTTGFVLYLLYLISLSPVVMSASVTVALLSGYTLFKVEAKSNAFWLLFSMIAMMAWGNIHVLYGVVFAYFWAWVGHFMIEHNKPASFTYPLWSLTGDFRMWIFMLRGHFWTQDCPRFKEEAKLLK
jgi:hypothetical protein